MLYECSVEPSIDNCEAVGGNRLYARYRCAECRVLIIVVLLISGNLVVVHGDGGCILCDGCINCGPIQSQYVSGRILCLFVKLLSTDGGS